MNKSDIKLVFIILSLIMILFAILSFTKKSGTRAEVYYEDDVIMTIDLNTDGEYKVDGYLGDVLLEVNDKKIRVKEEISPKNLCSKQGYTDSSNKPLICLPNKIIVKVIDDESSVDEVVY